MKGSCIFDFLANIPFELLMHRGDEIKKTRLFRLFKLFRVPRLFALLNVNRVKQIIGDHYQKILLTAVQNNNERETNSILKSIMLVQSYKIFRLSMIIFTSSYFLGIFWHILVCDFQTTKYNIPGDFDSGPVEPNFRTEKLMKDDPTNEDTSG